MESSLVLTKKHTNVLYGIAISMMLYHHLFCSPERLNFSFEFTLGEVASRFAWFCKFCVAIYAFISGYGLCKSSNVDNLDTILAKLKSSYQYVIKHCMKFYMKYWLVFFTFIPFGLVFGKFPDVSLLDFILALVGLKSYVLNQEWWYVGEYLFLLAIFPVIHTMIAHYQGVENRKRVFFFCLAASLIVVDKWNDWNWLNFFTRLIRDMHFSFSYIIIFCEGIFTARFGIFEKISNIKGFRKTSVGVYCILLGFIVALRILCADNASYSRIDIVITIPFVYCVCKLSDLLPKIFVQFGKLGNYSVYMWLVHTFYCYYYFQPIIAIGRIPIIMYIELFALSLVTAVVLRKIERSILHFLAFA